MRRSATLRLCPGRRAAPLAGDPGVDIGIRASTELTRSLIAARLVDHLRFVIPANIAGHGKRLFDADAADDLQRLKRVEVEQAPQGTLVMHYRVEPGG